MSEGSQDIRYIRVLLFYKERDGEGKGRLHLLSISVNEHRYTNMFFVEYIYISFGKCFL